jgi:hypothetical protein
MGKPEGKKALGRMSPSTMLRCVALVITDISEEYITSIIRVTGSGKFGKTLAVTSNGSTFRHNSIQSVQDTRKTKFLSLDNIKVDLGEIRWDDMDWIDMSQDRDNWRFTISNALSQIVGRCFSS